MKVIKTRKEHMCFDCLDIIPKGTLALSFGVDYGNHSTTVRFCPRCAVKKCQDIFAKLVDKINT